MDGTTAIRALIIACCERLDAERIVLRDLEGDLSRHMQGRA